MNDTELSAQTNASRRLYSVANQLNDLRGPIDVREYEPHNEAFGLTRAAVAAVAGQVVVGNTSYASYYGFKLPVYSRHNLPHHQFTGNDFKGIIKRLVNIDTPKVYGSGKRFCLQVAPLASGVDREWVDFYESRGQQAQLQHPFADEKKAGRTVYVPLDSMGERAVFFPQTPLESTDAPRRIPAW